METRYAVTHINRDGMRQLTFANQGRNHPKTEGEAKAMLKALIDNNSGADLKQVYGDHALMFEVRQIETFSHGDATGIYFDDPNAPFDQEMKRKGIKI